MKRIIYLSIITILLLLTNCNSNEPVESIAFVGEYELTITEEGPYIKGTKTPLNDDNPVRTWQWENKGWLRIVKESEKLFIYTHVGGKMVEYDNPTGYDWAYQIEVEKITGNKLILKPTVESDMIPLTSSDGTILSYADRYFVYGPIEKEGDRIYWEMEWDDNMGMNASTSGSGQDIQDYSIYLHIEGVIKQPENKEEPSVFVIDNGALPGKFSVSSSKQVQFSQGNLQYQASTNTWRFAEHQYDIIGEDNTYISSSYIGWIDLFGWGTGNNPINVSTDKSDYTYFIDWGTNKISNGANKANVWRTLTADEWVYLFHERINANELFGFGTINGVEGVIILPDNWSTLGGLYFTPTPLTWDVNSYIPSVTAYWDGSTWQAKTVGDNFEYNIYSLDEWSKMESAGAVFLPAAHYRFGVEYDRYGGGATGAYWSSKPKGDNAYALNFESDHLYPQLGAYRFEGVSVRLVR